jgi:hypothetical protein
MTITDKAKMLWKTWGVYDSKYTLCHECGEMKVCKQSSARSRWLCFECWDLSPESRR